MSDMSEITVKCNAKINLSLDVVRRRTDGYHDVEMIMHEIPLYDEVTVKKLSESSENSIIISCNKEEVPSGKDNIAWRAAEMFLKRSGIFGEFEIRIYKNIPMGAGLAGGSTDAAGVLKAMNKMFNNPFTHDELMKIGGGLGADVPFCVMGGCAFAEGIGDVLSPLAVLNGVKYLVAKPEFSVSTPWVYKNLDLCSVKTHPNTEEALKAVEKNDIKKLALFSGNVLETVTAKEFPVIEEYKSLMLSMGSVCALMSGSGPTVFGIFDDFGLAEKAFEKFNSITKEVFLV